jgi:hypothetical protein
VQCHGWSPSQTCGPFRGVLSDMVRVCCAQVSLVPPYDAASCKQSAPNAKLLDRIQKVVGAISSSHVTSHKSETSGDLSQ